MVKEKEIVNYNTEFHKKVVQDLLKLGITPTNREEIAFMSENDSGEISVAYKCMSTGLHYRKKDVEEQDVIEAGFKWWPTWNFYEK